jgi:Transglutaminase-like superfamily
MLMTIARNRLNSVARPIARPVVSMALLFVFLVTSLAFAPVHTPSHAPDDYDRWYTITLDTQRAGWMHLSQTSENGQVTTASQIRFSIRRGDELISIGYETTFVESALGEPIRAHKRDDLSANPLVVKYTFTPDGVEVRTTASGRTSSETKPVPEGRWLTPASATEFVARRLASGAKQIALRTIDPGAGLTPVGIRREVVGREELDVLGKAVEVYRCTAVYTSQPDVSVVEFLDDAGLLVRYETSLGEIRIEAMASTKAQALAQFRAPELMRSTFVRPDRAIASPRRIKRASFVLQVPEGSLQLPSLGVQRVEQMDDRTVRVTIDLDQPAPATITDRAVLEKASRLLDAADPVIQQMAARATRAAGDDKQARAEAMRRFVTQHIEEKALDVGFASASQVARDGRGDCTEHAVLLAAMLRADEIPSRVVSGLIYTPRFAGERNVFAFHMWTQALIETSEGERWLDLDATLPRGVAFDATHIAIAPANLGDDRSSDAFRPVARLLGRLTIEVESAR